MPPVPPLVLLSIRESIPLSAIKFTSEAFLLDAPPLLEEERY
jgi:hypothetical protein